MTFHRIADVPALQLHPQRIPPLSLLAVGRARISSFALWASSAVRCFYLSRQHQKDGNSALLSITSLAGFQDGVAGN